MQDITFALIITFILFSTYGVSLYQHEIVHTMINTRIGSNSHLEIKDLCGIPALAVIQDTIPTRDLTNAEIAHSFNETTNYNLVPMLMGIMLTIFVSTVYLKQKGVKNEK